MRILIHPREDAEGGNNLGDDVRKALEVLRTAYIDTEGGGTVGSNGTATGVVMIRHDSDLAKALATLSKAGIRASTP